MGGRIGGRTVSARPGGRDEGGFTIVEVIVGLFVFALVAVAALNVIVVTLRGLQQNSARTVAANLAARQVEAVRAQAASNIPVGLKTYTKDVGNTTYTIRQTANFVTNSGPSSACDSSSGSLAGKHVSVTVTWPNMGTAKAPQVDTMVAIKLGTDSVDQTSKGVLALAVKNGSGAAVPDIPVTLNPGNATYITGDDGCIVYTNLTPGAYTATVNQAGYVGTASTQSYTMNSLGVMAGTISKATLYYGPAKTVDITHDGPPSALVPGALPVKIGGGQMTDQTLPLCGGSPTSACISAQPLGTAKELYQEMYTAWAGACLDPMASGTATADVRSAPSATATVPVGVLTATVTYGGSPEPNANVTLTRKSLDITKPAPCADTETYTLSVGATGTAQIVLPYGKWQVKVPGGTLQEISLTGTGKTAVVTLPDTSH